MALHSINPATGTLLSAHAEFSTVQTQAAVEAAHRAFLVWSKTEFPARATYLREAARRLREGRERFAALMTAEMGKPIAQARAEADKCAACCEFFADHAAELLAPEAVHTEARRSSVRFPPLGVILAVMPWNFPFWQVFRAAVPALMAGNAVVLKHASNVTGCALACEEILQGAGLPDGLFRAVLVGGSRVPELVAHPRVRAVTLTGSTAAGAAVAAQAGALLKKTVLELGGSDPYLVLEDADLPATVETCIAARLINSGQSCIAAKRFIVVEPVRRQFEELLVSRMKQQKPGDPLHPDTTIGPLARRDLRDELVRQLERSLAAGARLLYRGQISASPGAYFAPAALTGVRRGMAAFDEETFGPIAAVVPVRDEAEAILAANDTVFGLGAAVFTADLARGERVAAQLEAGCVFVNDFVRSDPRLPFGGVKQSGYGRELSSFGLREFVNVQTLWVK